MSLRAGLLLALCVVLPRCTCAEEPVGEGEGEAGEGEGEAGEGEGEAGEGEGEGEGEPQPCVDVRLGGNLPAATVDRLRARVDAATDLALVVTPPDGTIEPAGLACDERTVVVIFGDAPGRAQVIDDDDVAAAGPEGYVLRSGLVDGRSALVTDGNPSDGERPSPGGAAFGSYALLEELGFAFMHPLAPTLPASLPATLPVVDVTTAPRWHVRNMHLHTMHPLELTELLNGWGDVRPQDAVDAAGLPAWNAMRPEWSLFLEWMIANGQNEVEWILLEAESWAAFSQSPERQRRLKLLVDDCHAFGVACGIDVPIALQQQHTFRLLREQGDPADEFAQIHERLDYLMAAGFDFLATENGSTEFTNPGAENMLRWIDETARYLDEEHGKEALIKIHCSTGQTADPFTDEDGGPLNFNFLPTLADPRMGVMPHTVQMYGLTDPAPTYGNTDFGYIREFLHQEVGRRAVVWHPETAYWVSVDVDVPLFLPLYAERRVADLQLLADDEDLGLMGRGEHAGGHIDGQSIFSSGWEWGYWLNDVVAARAAWDPHRGQDNPSDAMREILKPLARVLGRAGEPVVQEIIEIAEVEKTLLIDGIVDGTAPSTVVRRNGFAYLAGFEAFDDLADFATNFGINANVTQPNKLGLVEMRNPLHAAPAYTGEIDLLLGAMSEAFADAHDDLSTLIVDGPGLPLFDDVKDSLEMTRLRSDQLVGLYTYVDNLADLNDDDRAPALAAARAALDQAQLVVQRREAAYRVPLQRIAGWRENPTAYDFTYLWTVNSLYFWWRDEGKAVDGPVNPCYLNIINPADVGIGEGNINDATRVLRDLVDGGFLEGIGECVAAPAEEPTFPHDELRSRP